MQKTRINPIKLIGITVRTTNENNQAATDIPELWQRFMGEGIMEKISNKLDSTVYSVYMDYEGDYTKPYTTMLGCEVSDFGNIPEGLEARTFESGYYLKSSVRGNLKKGIVIDHWKKIWNTEIERAYTADFEVYGEKAQNPMDAEVEFYLALKE
ncbi:Predicted transcriptional regulator YdeE, contains AraC-type DNA-binding domain [Marivirga sericea]|uniref:Predicted transcriptional regulator YdeE, contains AraC-type DNA-binding domain n=1 Tax=Marivirga sericea TaxID=1028 RepID=A0A1X7J3S3_9BACT|nr:GyrI-like domain-containing protein [Marivirga sericea]SMG21965.1 Predicted transcriptional regulator YdeE, contains AraC-type DNA-binding domain [Marivirga sericea]